MSSKFLPPVTVRFYDSTRWTKSSLDNWSDIQLQNLLKLKINRVAIVQQLKVEHVLDYLVEESVVSQRECNLINSYEHATDKARVLIDILPTKTGQYNWYKLFKQALLNPDTESTECKKQYRMLVDFMENTLLPEQLQTESERRGSDAGKLPYYRPIPGISKFWTGKKEVPRTNSSGDENGKSSRRKKCTYKAEDLDEGNVEPPAWYQSNLTEQKEFFDKLSQSKKEEDKKQLKREEVAWVLMLKLEFLFTLQKQELITSEFEVPLSNIFYRIVTENHYLPSYLKYLHYLREFHSTDIMDEIASRLIEILNDPKTKSDRDLIQIFNIVIGLQEFLCEMGNEKRAEKLLLAAKTLTNPDVIWFYKINTLLMGIYIDRADFNEARKFIIDSPKFEKCSLYVQIARLNREEGNLEAALSSSKDALKEAVEGSEFLAQDSINAKIELSLTEALMWNLRDAEETAQNAFLVAEANFGKRHPMFYKACLNYFEILKQFNQEIELFKLTRRLLSSIDTCYGNSISLAVADVNRLMASVIMSLQQDHSKAHACAMRAVEIAQELLPPNHPKIAYFRHTLAQSLYYSSRLHNSNEDLTWAEKEASTVLDTYRLHWGEESSKTAVAQSLLAQIQTKLGKTEEAKTAFENIVKRHHCPYIKVLVGTFYNEISAPVEAINILRKALQPPPFTQKVFLKWISKSYELLNALLHACGNTQGAFEIESEYSDWAMENDELNVEWATIFVICGK